VFYSNILYCFLVSIVILTATIVLFIFRAPAKEGRRRAGATRWNSYSSVKGLRIGGRASFLSGLAYNVAGSRRPIALENACVFLASGFGEAGKASGAEGMASFLPLFTHFVCYTLAFEILLHLFALAKSSTSERPAVRWITLLRQNFCPVFSV